MIVDLAFVKFVGSGLESKEKVRFGRLRKVVGGDNNCNGANKFHRGIVEQSIEACNSLGKYLMQTAIPMHIPPITIH